MWKLFFVGLIILTSFFSIQGIYAQEEGRPILCQEILAEQCSIECLEEFGEYNQEYKKCLNQCISVREDECPPLPLYELDFAQEPSISELSEQEREGMTGEEYKAFREALERLEREEQLRAEFNVLIPIILALVGVGIPIMLVKRRNKQRGFH